jgi:hypothetical protein
LTRIASIEKAHPGCGSWNGHQEAQDAQNMILFWGNNAIRHPFAKIRVNSRLDFRPKVRVAWLSRI